jgi:hypothetical protein
MMQLVCNIALETAGESARSLRSLLGDKQLCGYLIKYRGHFLHLAQLRISVIFIGEIDCTVYVTKAVHLAAGVPRALRIIMAKLSL